MPNVWDLCYTMGMTIRDAKGRFIKGYKSFMTEATRKKISESAKSSGVGKWVKGKKLSEATKLKIKNNNAKYWLGKKRLNLVGNQYAKGNKPNSTSFKKGHVPPTLGKFGEDHPRWVDPKKNPLRQAIRQLFQYREWRSNVFKKDNYTCLFCKKDKEVSGKLEADHYPKSFASIIANINSVDEAINCKELWDINNGRTLCKECHKSTDNFMWKARMK